MIGPAPGTLRWLQRFMKALPEGGAVLDLGCGAGQPIARHLIDHGFQVTGVDYDGRQIELAHTRFPRHRWLRGDMRTIALDDTFDGVLAWDCLSLMSREEQGRMAARAAAWLKPGGWLLFSVRPDLENAVADYRAGSPYHEELGPTDHNAAIAAHGLIVMAHVEQDEACDGAGVWLARKSPSDQAG